MAASEGKRRDVIGELRQITDLETWKEAARKHVNFVAERMYNLYPAAGWKKSNQERTDAFSAIRKIKEGGNRDNAHQKISALIAYLSNLDYHLSHFESLARNVNDEAALSHFNYNGRCCINQF